MCPSVAQCAGVMRYTTFNGRSAGVYSNQSDNDTMYSGQ